ncbi:MAG TPA: tetratricopeptide repeat protein [Spirochaetota bacterium]|nr:tetratricopeptide repeat protein [Spirochaetota bacterium]
MGQEIAMGGKKWCRICIAVVLSGFFACSGSRRDEVVFNYGKIIRENYRQEVGRIVPVAIEQSTEIDGVFSDNELYFFFASDRDRGNFDIYLRTLTGITTVRLTEHPSKDSSPAISPDGRHLAFVSQREDPEGDIYVVRIKPKELIARAAESVSGSLGIDKKAKNITQFLDPVTKSIHIVKDAGPAWSPDSERIAFSSTRGGVENVWMVDRDGQNLHQITQKGGMHPSFSRDGKLLTYISYRERQNNGDVYVYDIASKSERKITGTKSIEMYPVFLGNNTEIAFTRIDRDTNGDGKINLRDNTVLYYRNLGTGDEYPLTLYSNASFAPRWSPVLKVLNSTYDDVLIYSDQIGQNININIIPSAGVIPKRNNAAEQYELSERYLKEYNDVERYRFSLERVYHFFGRRSDEKSVVFTSKALVDAARDYVRGKDLNGAKRMGTYLKKMSREEKDYAGISAHYVQQVIAGGQGDGILRDGITALSRSSKKQGYVPYLMEDLGDEFMRTGRMDNALQVFRDIKQKYPKYGRSGEINLKIGVASFRTPRNRIPDEYLAVFKKGNIYQKIDAMQNILDVFNAEKNAPQKIAVCKAALTQYDDKSERVLNGLMMYIIGDSYFSMGDYVRAKDYLKKSLDRVSRADLPFYRANKILGDIAEREGRLNDMSEFYFKSAANYRLRWNQPDFSDVATKLINYYEDNGDALMSGGKYRDASKIFKRSVALVSYIHILRQFGDIYEKYSSRAHIRYIDASILSGNRERMIETLDKEYSRGLNAARMNFDKAYLYGYAYLFTKKALTFDRSASGNREDISGGDLRELLGHLRLAVEQVDWCLFMDDTYIDPYLLKGWISQYVDLRRRDLRGRKEGIFKKYFPRYLWEANVPFYERALSANDETVNPEIEGNIHLNLGNTYFLLTNYPVALRHYESVLRYKRSFSSTIEEALFHFHLGFCYWQDDQLDRARAEMQKTLVLYQSLAQLNGLANYKNQIYTIYRYFALFSRMENDWSSAIIWFERILEFATANNIDIDRARYMQEIAFCFKKLGDTDRAIVYLDNADSILAGMDHDEQTYKLRWRFFGFGPLQFWNLGPDVAVIGDNRILTELSVRDKKLLNLSLREEIAFEKGDYRNAMDYQKKKLAIWEESSTSVSQAGAISTLNNIGYSAYRLKDYGRALEYFRKAWDYAADPDVNDLSGIFSSIMNLTNLSVVLVERSSPLLADPAVEVQNLIGRIGEYKKSYKKNRYDTELKNLQNEAKAKKREVAAEEISTLKMNIEESAKAIYYNTDIAVGLLKWCYAEYLTRNGNFSTKYSGEPYAAYADNKKVFDLYADAGRGFRSAQIFAETQQSKRMFIKLLLNIASCEKRTGKLQSAYEVLTSAESLAKKYRYEDVMWLVNFKMGEFLSEYGAAVEGRSAQSLSEAYYRKAFDAVEFCPGILSGQYHQVLNLYDSYIAQLLSRDRGKDALLYSEKRYAVSRIMTAAHSHIEFHRAEDRQQYDAFTSRISTLRQARESLSAFLESGESDDSPKAQDLQRKVEDAVRAYGAMKTDLERSGSLFASYVVIPGVRAEGPSGSEVLQFLRYREGLWVWNIKGSVQFSKIADLQNGTDAASVVCGYLKKEPVAQGRKRFIVLNSFFTENVLRSPELKGVPSFTCVPSVERVRYYLSGVQTPLRSAYVTGPDIMDRLRSREVLRGVAIAAAGKKDAALSEYSLIVDNDGSKAMVTNYMLYRTHATPQFFVKRADPFDAEYINTVMESSLYSGIKSVIFYTGLDDSGIADIVDRAVKGPIGGIAPDTAFAGKAFGAGYSK